MNTFNITPDISPNVKLTANVVLQNFGKTPAFIDELGTKLEVRNSPVPEDYNYKMNTSSFVLFPTQSPLMGETELTISQPEFDAVKAKTKNLVFHGTTKYHDSFGRHWTTFCLQWSLNAKWFQSCREHNGADQEKYDQQTSPAQNPN